MTATAERTMPVYTVHAGELLYVKNLCDQLIRKRLARGQQDESFHWLCGLSLQLYRTAEYLANEPGDVALVTADERKMIENAYHFVLSEG